MSWKEEFRGVATILERWSKKYSEWYESVCGDDRPTMMTLTKDQLVLESLKTLWLSTTDIQLIVKGIVDESIFPYPKASKINLIQEGGCRVTAPAIHVYLLQHPTMKQVHAQLRFLYKRHGDVLKSFGDVIAKELEKPQSPERVYLLLKYHRIAELLKHVGMEVSEAMMMLNYAKKNNLPIHVA